MQQGKIINNPNPMFTCPQENDKFTVSPSNGENGTLSNPVGLITTDEFIAAGSGSYGTKNESFYLNKESLIWRLLSPFNYSGEAEIFAMNRGALSYSLACDYYVAVYPVISIKQEYLSQVKGNGTVDNPFYFEN